MHRVGTLTLSIRIEHSRSLKDKRQVLRSLKDRLRRRHNVSVAEVAGQASWQNAVVVAAAVASTSAGTRKVLEAAEADAATLLGPSLTESVFDLELA